MKILNNYKQSDIVYLDIETARSEDKLKKGTPLYEAFSLKHRHNNEYQEKLNRAGNGTPVEVTLDEFFEKKASLYGTFGRVVTIVAGRLDGEILKVKAYADKDERKLLQDFVNDLALITAAHPETCFCTFNGIQFDIPFVSKRLLVHGIPLPPLFDLAGEKPWLIREIDLSDLWRGQSYYPDSMLSVAVALGIPSPKTAMDGSEVSNAFYTGKIDEIVKYCKQDVLCTCNIHRKFQGKSLVKLAE